MNYRDRDFGFFDDVIKLASFKYPAYIVYDSKINIDGTKTYLRKKIEITGSLQTYRRRRNYNNDGPATSRREGKFYSDYTNKLSEGDIIQKNDEFYIITDMDDYDYAGVRNYPVERLGMDEIHKYNFFELVEQPFSKEDKSESVEPHKDKEEL